MKTYKKILLSFASVTLLLFIGMMVISYVSIIRPIRVQMWAGKQYIDALTPERILELTVWSDELLLKNEGNKNEVVPVEIPQELKEAKVLNVEVHPPSRVIISWIGGLDHTAIFIDQDPATGLYTVLAIYNDEEEKIIWPMLD